MKNEKLKLPVILGATGVGKTEIAIQVAIKIGAEIISCDSRQVYKYMNIGTAKPTKEQLKRVPHHMIDIITPDVDFNAWDYAKLARKEIEGIVKEGKLPLVVGGSGLYLRALIDGFFSIPKPSKDIRERLEKESLEALYQKLYKIDKPTALKLHPNDRQRIMRAIEVYEITKIPVSKLKSNRVGLNCKPVYVGLNMERDELYRRIEKRVDKMLKNGFLDEVKGLIYKGYSPELNSLQTIGYKELISVLGGKISLSSAAQLIKRNTKRYVKRQFTWFKGMKDIHWIELPDKEAARKCVEKLFGKPLSGGNS
ncbi:tRNA (adenosine(37)-N6)-dimethylallyltransferase MiaA [candidate division WOR-3 bacterium]|nr:tRNA (adenosine(37)-N6)-dimethylallyltransferase MiaA [candidate division WOR-3 bacterium]